MTETLLVLPISSSSSSPHQSTIDTNRSHFNTMITPPITLNFLLVDTRMTTTLAATMQETAMRLMPTLITLPLQHLSNPIKPKPDTLLLAQCLFNLSTNLLSPHMGILLLVILFNIINRYHHHIINNQFTIKLG